jgi:hypothetical protein
MRLAVVPFKYFNKEEATMARFLRLMMGALVIANLTAACTTHERVETVRYEDRRTGEPVAVERQTTTETTTEDNGGILSGTVNVIGEVIALPFRAVAGLFRAIF